MERAKSKLGTGSYNLKNYNSEHFAAWCKCGVYCSRMIKDYSLAEFQEFVPGFDTMDMYGHR